MTTDSTSHCRYVAVLLAVALPIQSLQATSAVVPMLDVHFPKEVSHGFNAIAPGANAEDFFHDYFARTYFHWPRQVPSVSLPDVPLEDAAGFENMLRLGRIEQSNSKGTSPVKDMSHKEFLDEVQGGGSFVFHLPLTSDSIWGSSIGDLRNQLEDTFRTTVSANVYVSGPKGSALKPHTDRYDTLILQLRGSKRWKLCVPRLTSFTEVLKGYPLTPADVCELKEAQMNRHGGCTNYDMADLESTMTCDTIVTEPGDFLYMPKGLVHVAMEESGGVSVHATLGLSREGATVSDFMRHIIQRRDVVEAVPKASLPRIHTVVKQSLEALTNAPPGFGWRRLFPLYMLPRHIDATKDRYETLYAWYLILLEELEMQIHWEADVGVPYTSMSLAWNTAIGALFHRISEEDTFLEGLASFHESRLQARSGYSLQQESRSTFSSSYEFCNGVYDTCVSACGVKIEGCDATCFSSCDDVLVPAWGSCDGDCDSSCDGSCDDGRTCDHGCDGSCDGSCDGGCDGSCDHWGVFSCDSSCDSSCDNDCDNSCDDSCYYTSGCDSGCDGFCDGDCDLVPAVKTGCDGSCTTSCDEPSSLCTSACESAASSCEETANDFADLSSWVDQAWEDMGDMFTEAGEYIVNTWQTVSDCINTDAASDPFTFEELLECYGGDASLTEKVQTAMDTLSTDDLLYMLEEQRISQEMCSVIWDFLEPTACWVNFVQNLPTADLCYTDEWTSPALAISFSITVDNLPSSSRSSAALPNSIAVGLWADTGGDRGCFVEVAAPVSSGGSTMEPPELSAGFTISLVQSSGGTCGFAIGVEPSFDFGTFEAGVALAFDTSLVDGALEMNFPSWTSFVPTAIGISLSGGSPSGGLDVSVTASYANSVSVNSGDLCSPPSNNIYETLLAALPSSRRRELHTDPKSRSLQPPGPIPPEGPGGAQPPPPPPPNTPRPPPPAGRGWVHQYAQRATRVLDAFAMDFIPNLWNAKIAQLTNTPDAIVSSEAVETMEREMNMTLSVLNELESLVQGFLDHLHDVSSEVTAPSTNITSSFEAHLEELETNVFPLAEDIQTEIAKLQSQVNEYVLSAQVFSLIQDALGDEDEDFSEKVDLLTSVFAGESDFEVDDGASRVSDAALVAIGAVGGIGIAIGLFLLVLYGMRRRRRPSNERGQPTGRTEEKPSLPKSDLATNVVHTSDTNIAKSKQDQERKPGDTTVEVSFAI